MDDLQVLLAQAASLGADVLTTGWDQNAGLYVGQFAAR